MIHSMTAFASKQASGDWGSAIWELRSVNHRYLDFYFKIPEGLRELEPTWRTILSQTLSRGKIDCFLRFHPSQQQVTDLHLNLSLVHALVKSCDAISKITGNQAPVSTYNILHWPGVVIMPETDLSHAHIAINQLLSETVESLVAIRKREGSALKNIIAQRLHTILEYIHKARTFQQSSLTNSKARLVKRFEELKFQLETSRLEQEIVLLVQKIDIAEELDRLETHVNEIFRLLQQQAVIGRRLDFLLQELTREANTLGAKSIDTEVTGIAVELKVLIEQIREQVQNIE